MGFLLAAIVISITLLGDREARRSERQIDNTHKYQEHIRDALGLGQPITPASISEWVSRARAESDTVILAARILNTVLIGIVVVVGSDALRLLWAEDAEGPLDAPLLVIGLMLGAVVTGAYGEVHAKLERSKAEREFAASDLGLLERVSAALRGDARPVRPKATRRGEAAPVWKFGAGGLKNAQLQSLETQIAQVEERYPDWALVPELQAMEQLVAGQPDEAIAVLTPDKALQADDYNLPILLTAAMARAGRQDEVLPLLDGIVTRRGTDRIIEELRFDLAVANAHRTQLFTTTRSPWIDELRAVEPLEFDVSLGDVEETYHLRRLGRAWMSRRTDLSWRPDQHADHRRLPLSWVWQIAHGEVPDGGWDAIRTWRDGSPDAGALESVGFACLAVDRGDEAVDLFERAIVRNSKSGASHWGLSLAYFQRSWRTKATTSLKRARICDFSSAICDITAGRFAGVINTDFADMTHKFGAMPDFSEMIALSLLGVETPITDDGSPRNRFAVAFTQAARSSVAIAG